MQTRRNLSAEIVRCGVALAVLLRIGASSPLNCLAQVANKIPTQGQAVTAPVEATGANTSRPPGNPASLNKILTEQQTKELFDSVDEIMKFVSSDTGLPPVVNINRRMLSHQEAETEIDSNLNFDTSVSDSERSELVLKKLGILSRDFDLHQFLSRLMIEQLTAWYEPGTNTISLMNWIDPEDQKPTLAHELTHAVQVQLLDTDDWLDGGITYQYSISDSNPAEDNKRVATDEIERARTAVLEGQAETIMYDYMLKSSGKTLAESPGLSVDFTATDPVKEPMLAQAPLYLERSLLFPYQDGLTFEQALLAAGGKSAAFTGALKNPPATSFEIMNPQVYLHHAVVPVLQIPDTRAVAGEEYVTYEVGSVGELDVEIMAKLFGGSLAARALAPAWAGGLYYAAQRKAASADERLNPASLALMYYSEWDSPGAAQSFRDLYQAELWRKYTAGIARSTGAAPGETVFTTNEGDVLLWQKENSLFISEGFPLALARKLRDATVAAQGSRPIHLAGDPSTLQSPPELTLSAVRSLGQVGLLNTIRIPSGVASPVSREKQPPAILN